MPEVPTRIPRPVHHHRSRWPRPDLAVLLTIVSLLLLLALGVWMWAPASLPPAYVAPAGDGSGHVEDDQLTPVPMVPLTPEEQAYIQSIGPITVAPDPDWVPYEYVDEDGDFTGIAADLLDLVQERLGIEFTYVFPGDWGVILEESRAGNVLILPFLNQTPDREDWLVFTEPLLVDPSVFITREEHPFIFDATGLTDESIAFPVGTSLEERVQRDFPNLHIVHVERENDVFQAVANRSADMALRPLTVAAYTIRKEGLFNLKIAGQAPEHYTNHLRMGVLKEHAMLRDILDRAIATISHREREEIVNRHVNITVVQPFDYGVLMRLVVVAGILLMLTSYWNLRLRRLNAALAESERSKSVLLANLPGMAYRGLLDRDWTMEFVSEGVKSLTGWQPSDLTGESAIRYASLIHPEDVEVVWQAWSGATESWQPVSVEYRIRTRDHKERWVFDQGVPIGRDSSGTPIIEGLVIDITDRKHAEKALYEVSIHDQLTGIFNRRHIFNCLNDMLIRAAREHTGLCVAIIDLDHFKTINDTLGHGGGDTVLRGFGQRLKASVRPYDLVGRYGGEEFIVAVSDVDLPTAASMLERFLEQMNADGFEVAGEGLKVTFSAGIADIGEPGMEPLLEPLLARADARLYAAKRAGRNCIVTSD
ncbi:diguanylate cyclase [Ectothiorhodospira variabilis]|uniref:diguanylate cyclase n=1 Tax=Ectothiorhodospira variabilis TaxID=505694 RepID=UPI001EFA8724|nr:diguanylate cyclase [Ectothiorhodospira variabilis]MCG5498205.1 diguanylate cyclase [Ectothiorhodospira variabilis]